jgi:hypothetical protein
VLVVERTGGRLDRRLAQRAEIHPPSFAFAGSFSLPASEILAMPGHPAKGP